MRRTGGTARPPYPVRHDHRVRDAWIAVCLFPPAVLAAGLLGVAALRALGYPDGEGAPLGLMLAVGLLAFALAVSPAVVAFVLGNRARRAGNSRGTAPAVVGAVLVTGFVLVNVLAAAMLG